MARRRTRGEKIGAGIGASLEDFFGFLLKNRLIEKQQERIEGRQAKLSRQQFVQGLTRDLTTSVAKGDYDPPQAAEMFKTFAGSTEQVPDFTAFRPQLRRRLAPTEERIDAAKAPEDVPALESIFADAAKVDAPNVAGLMDFAERGDVDLASLVGEAPTPVRDLATRGGARRRALEQKPTETVTGFDPMTGAGFTRRMSAYDLRDPFTTGPTSEQAGRLEGVKKLAELESGPSPELLGSRAAIQEKAMLEGVGPMRATQAGAEARASAQGRLDVETSPQAISGAARRASATRTAEINAQLAKSKELLAFETAKAVEAMKLLPLEVQSREYGRAIQEAHQTASEALPQISRLRALWEAAQPEMEALAANSEMLAQMAEAGAPRGMLPTAVRNYMDFRDSMRPFLARMMKQTGNPALLEQEWAVRGGPDFIDAVNGGVSGDNKLDWLEATFAVAPKIVQELNRPDVAATMDPAQRTSEINKRIDEALATLQKGRQPAANVPLDQIDILITPQGMRPVRRPGGR